MPTNKMVDFKESYEQRLDQIKNHIMNLQIKFGQSKSEIEVDYQNGLLTKEQRDLYKKAKILDVIDAPYSKYALSKEDRIFLQENAEFINGEITIDLINPSYNQKLEEIEQIYRTIEILSYYMSFPLEERKQEYSAVVVPYLEKEIATLTSEIKAIKTQCKDKYYMYPSYAPISQKVRKYEKNLENFNRFLPSLTEAELNGNIARFYSLNPTYYEWFIEKQRQSQAHDKNYFNNHLNTVKDTKRQTKALDSLVIRRQQIKEQITTLLYNLNQFLVEGIKICGYQDNSKKQSKLFNKKINLEEYYHLFEMLLTHSIFQMYLETYIKEPQSIEQAFTIYANKRYQGMPLPNISDFKVELFLDISTFINNQIADLSKEEYNLSEIIQVERTKLSTANNELIKESEDIVKTIEISEKDAPISLGTSFTNSEEQALYESLESKLKSNTSKEEQKKLLNTRK